MQKHKIIFLIPSMRGGGAEKVTLLLGNELVSNNWDVTFLMTKVEGPYLSKINKKIRIQKLPFIKVSRNILAIRSYLIENQPDIFYTTMNYVNIIGGLSYRLTRGKTKFIPSEHSNLIEVLNNVGWLERNLMKLGLILSYPSADKIVCVSKGVELSIQKLLPYLSQTKVIYNPIEQYFPNKYNTINKTFNILSIGRLSKEKNFSLLIDSFNYLINNFPIDARLTIIGEGEKRAQLEQLIHRKNLNSKVSLPGFQNPEEFLNRADVFVLSSEREGFGNVIVEALSAGVPVVSTDCPSGPAEILDYGKYGELVPVNDYISMANAIYKIYSSSFLSINRNYLVERAKDFAPEVIIPQYIRLFESIIKK